MPYSSFLSMKHAAELINCGRLFFVPVVGHFAAQVYTAAGTLPSKLVKAKKNCN